MPLRVNKREPHRLPDQMPVPDDLRIGIQPFPFDGIQEQPIQQQPDRGQDRRLSHTRTPTQTPRQPTQTPTQPTQMSRNESIAQFGDATIASQLADYQMRNQQMEVSYGADQVPIMVDPGTNWSDIQDLRRQAPGDMAQDFGWYDAGEWDDRRLGDPGEMWLGGAPVAHYTWDDITNMSPEEREQLNEGFRGLMVGGQFFQPGTDGEFTLEQKQQINALLEQGHTSEFVAIELPSTPTTDPGKIPTDPGETPGWSIGAPPEFTPGQAPSGAPSLPTLTPGGGTPSLIPGGSAPTMQSADSQYRGALEGLLADRPYYEMSEQEMLDRAARDAGLIIDPHQRALGRAHESLQHALQSQRDQAEAAHTGYQADLDYALSEAQRRAVESSIARGGGRAGMVDWQSAQLQAPIMGAAQATAAKHEATLKDIAGQKTMAQRHYNEHMTELEQRRGELTQQRAQQLEELQYARATDDWDRAWRATQQLEVMDEQIRQFDNQMNLAHAQFQEQQRQFDNQMNLAHAQFSEGQRQFDSQFSLQRAAMEQQQWQFSQSLQEQQRQWDQQMQQRQHEFIENLTLGHRKLDLTEKKLISDLAFRDKQFEAMLEQWDLDYALREWITQKPWDSLTAWEKNQLAVMIAGLMGQFPDLDFDFEGFGGGM